MVATSRVCGKAVSALEGVLQDDGTILYHDFGGSFSSPHIC